MPYCLRRMESDYDTVVCSHTLHLPTCISFVLLVLKMTVRKGRTRSVLHIRQKVLIIVGRDLHWCCHFGDANSLIHLPDRVVIFKRRQRYYMSWHNR